MTTMLSFRVDDELASALDAAAREDGVSRSHLLDAALRAAIYRRACERDAERYDDTPFTSDELVDPAAQAWTKGRDGATW